LKIREKYEVSDIPTAWEISSMERSVPATLLKTHPDFILYLDENSASGILK